MIRAGRNSVFYNDFIDKKVVSIGWRELGDLSNFLDAEEISQKTNECYEGSEAQIRNYSNQVSKFLFDVKVGDNVITYDSSSRKYIVGIITGDYEFNPKLFEDMPNIKRVKWNKTVSRDDLSANAKNSLGAIQTLFKPNREATQEILAKIRGDEYTPKNEEIIESDTSPRDILEQAEEFIKDKLVRISWEDMQELVAGILRAMGYKTRISPPGPDRGVDIFASPDGLGLTQPRIFVEVKHRQKTAIGSKDIRNLIGGRNAQQDKCLFVSTGGYTKDAHMEAVRSNVPLTLLDLDDLVDLLVQYYGNLDPETKSIIPLTKVYWPQA